MSKKTVLFFKKQDNLESIKELVINKHDIPKGTDDYILYSCKKMKILYDNYEKNEVKGYISVCKNNNKKEKTSIRKINSAINGTVAVRKKKNFSEEIVGYIRINDEIYALVRNNIIFLIGLFLQIIILLLIFGMIVFNIKQTLPKPSAEPVVKISEPEPEQTEKGTGSLDVEKPEYKSDGFRFKINTAPVISDGKMNVRIESPLKENEEFVATYKYVISGKIDANYNVIEEYEEPIVIYESPQVFGNENIEFASIKTELEEGYYTGVCYCSVYDKQGNYLTTNGATIRLYSE